MRYIILETFFLYISMRKQIRNAKGFGKRINTFKDFSMAWFLSETYFSISTKNKTNENKYVY